MELICAQTWEWGDYVPSVWDEWLADEQGAFIVGDLGPQMVALSKITFLSPDEIWLEGMRVASAFRGQGIAERFLGHSLTYAREHGARTVRLGTGDHNLPVHRIASRAGMECVGRYVLWVADPMPGGVPPPFLAESHWDRVWRFLSSSLAYAHCNRLYSVDWAWQTLSEEKLGSLIQDGAVAATRSAAGDILALAILHFDPEDKALWIGFSDESGSPAPESPGSALTKLATAVRAYATDVDAASVRTMLPNIAPIRDAYQTAGYGYGDWGGELWIFELSLTDVPDDAHER